MVYHKSFPKTLETDSGFTHTVWEEISIDSEEEFQIEKKAKQTNFAIMKDCINDSKKLLEDMNMKDYQQSIIQIAINLFSKKAEHLIYYKDRRCKEIFEEGLNKSELIK